MQERLVTKEKYEIEWDQLSSGAKEVCKHVGQCMYNLKTRGDGACGLHAVFGEPSDTGEFVKTHATEFAASMMSSGIASLSNNDQSKSYADAILESCWSEFVLPFLREEASHESELFWEALREKDLDLQQECIAFFIEAQTADKRTREARQVLHQASRQFFFESTEQDVVLPVAKWLGLVPDVFDPTRMSEQGYIGTLLREYPDTSDFLEPACSAEGFIKGTREQFPLFGPCCKYQALLDGRICFDKLREAFVIVGGGRCDQFLQALQHVLSTRQLRQDQVNASQQFKSVVLRFAQTQGSSGRPPNFSTRSWPVYLNCIQRKRNGMGYYFSVDELLALATIAHVNLIVFKSSENKLVYAGENLRGNGPVVFIKLAGSATQRVHSHFERLIPQNDIKHLEAAASQHLEEELQKKEAADKAALDEQRKLDDQQALEEALAEAKAQEMKKAVASYHALLAASRTQSDLTQPPPPPIADDAAMAANAKRRRLTRKTSLQEYKSAGGIDYTQPTATPENKAAIGDWIGFAVHSLQTQDLSTSPHPSARTHRHIVELSQHIRCCPTVPGNPDMPNEPSPSVFDDKVAP